MDVAPPLSAHVLCSRFERLDVKALAQRRQQALHWRGQPLPSSALKHVDEQSFAALLTVLQAITDEGLENHDFADWGVVGAPRFIGRAGLEPQLRKFLAEGPWSVSPHAIPHRCLHSPSGLISQLLGWHGANVGAGGGLSSVGEAFLTALACLTEDVAGLWLVLSAYDPERLPDCVPQPVPWHLEVLALAITPNVQSGSRGCLEIVPALADSREQDLAGKDARLKAAEPAFEVNAKEESLESPSALKLIAEALSGSAPVPRCWRLGVNLTLRWTPHGGCRRDLPHEAHRPASNRINLGSPSAAEANA
jgi:hypothetical protein